MQPYKDRSGNSGVTSFDISKQSTAAQLGSGWSYRETNQSAKHSHVATLKKLLNKARA